MKTKLIFSDKDIKTAITYYLEKIGYEVDKISLIAIHSPDFVDRPIGELDISAEIETS